jgi:2Fe-2S ferredoxin
VRPLQPVACVPHASNYVLNDIYTEMNDDEEAMLSEAFYVKSNSRLGCQIPITESLEG